MAEKKSKVFKSRWNLYKMWQNVDWSITSKNGGSVLVNAPLPLPTCKEIPNITSHSCKYAQMNRLRWTANQQIQTEASASKWTAGSKKRKKERVPVRVSAAPVAAQAKMRAGDREGKKKKTGCEQTGCKQRAIFYWKQKMWIHNFKAGMLKFIKYKIHMVFVSFFHN